MNTSASTARDKAIVAIARQMLLVLWHVWHDREADQPSDPTATARTMMTWAEQGGKAMHLDLSATQFVRLQVDRLGSGQELTALHYGSHDYRLPPAGSVKVSAAR